MKKEKKEIDLYISNVMTKKRLERGWTQTQIALYMGVSVVFINAVQNRNKPDHLNVYHINLLAEIFNCSPREFLPETPILEK
jgi:transcriptional regulator with XRE-family HTH domain